MMTERLGNREVGRRWKQTIRERERERERKKERNEPTDGQEGRLTDELTDI